MSRKQPGSTMSSSVGRSLRRSRNAVTSLLNSTARMQRESVSRLLRKTGNALA
jgi:hypothetical protein